MAKYTISVNGAKHDVQAMPDTPLLWVLRDSLGLTGAKYGCGIGACGACTVLVDGDSQRSCNLPISEVGNSQVTTIEGLSASGLHALQAAWIEEDVPQCGYCQAGQIMSAAALLKKNPKPSDAEVEAAMDGNICRCGTYERVRRAVRRASTGGGQ